ncbi:MAG: class I SAM-dependent methyltransferase [Hyphomicrobiaceae bacterium]|nr:class I SAM-dependent methyltransferase [Hyphomicrobiaceae bacterium]
MRDAIAGPGSPEDRFAFGRNWASYSKLIGEPQIAEAVAALQRLLRAEELAGRSFLDIGSGSGLHSVAAARLGVSRILAVDVDPDSTATTRTTLEQHGGSTPWTAVNRSIFDLRPAEVGTFDAVYSWGVLHHTGDMMRAIDMAAALVAPGGLFAFALYRRTRLDWFWTREKRWYIKASPSGQRAAQRVYTGAYRLACALTGRRAQMERGMDYTHDLHDWLGGYPYESILASEVESHMTGLGFAKVRELARPLELGLFGSGCDEYVYRRTAP